jgi:hypothetical protein
LGTGALSAGVLPAGVLVVFIAGVLTTGVRTVLAGGVFTTGPCVALTTGVLTTGARGVFMAGVFTTGVRGLLTARALTTGVRGVLTAGEPTTGVRAELTTGVPTTAGRGVLTTGVLGEGVRVAARAAGGLKRRAPDCAAVLFVRGGFTGISSRRTVCPRAPVAPAIASKNANIPHVGTHISAMAHPLALAGIGWKSHSSRRTALSEMVPIWIRPLTMHQFKIAQTKKIASLQLDAGGDVG